MRALLLILLLLISPADSYSFGISMAVPANNYVCATPAGGGNILANEGFQTPTTAFEQSGWSYVGNAGYCDTTEYSTAKPTGACSAGYQSNYTSSTVWQYAQWDYGSSLASTTYFRFYLYVQSETLAGNQFATIFGVYVGTTVSGGYRPLAISLHKNGTQLELIGGGNVGDSTTVAISTSRWYLVDVKYVPNGTSAFKVDGGSENTFPTTYAGYTSWRSFTVGNSDSSYASYTYNNTIFDLVSVGTAGYIGGM